MGGTLSRRRRQDVYLAEPEAAAPAAAANHEVEQEDRDPRSATASAFSSWSQLPDNAKLLVAEYTCRDYGTWRALLVASKETRGLAIMARPELRLDVSIFKCFLEDGGDIRSLWSSWGDQALSLGLLLRGDRHGRESRLAQQLEGVAAIASHLLTHLPRASHLLLLLGAPSMRHSPLSEVLHALGAGSSSPADSNSTAQGPENSGSSRTSSALIPGEGQAAAAVHGSGCSSPQQASTQPFPSRLRSLTVVAPDAMYVNPCMPLLPALLPALARLELRYGAGARADLPRGPAGLKQVEVGVARAGNPWERRLVVALAEEPAAAEEGEGGEGVGGDGGGGGGGGGQGAAAPLDVPQAHWVAAAVVAAEAGDAAAAGAAAGVRAWGPAGAPPGAVVGQGPHPPAHAPSPSQQQHQDQQQQHQQQHHTESPSATPAPALLPQLQWLAVWTGQGRPCDLSRLPAPLSPALRCLSLPPLALSLVPPGGARGDEEELEERQEQQQQQPGGQPGQDGPGTEPGVEAQGRQQQGGAISSQEQLHPHARQAQGQAGAATTRPAPRLPHGLLQQLAWVAAHGPSLQQLHLQLVLPAQQLPAAGGRSASPGSGGSHGVDAADVLMWLLPQLPALQHLAVEEPGGGSSTSYATGGGCTTGGSAGRDSWCQGSGASSSGSSSGSGGSGGASAAQPTAAAPAQLHGLLQALGFRTRTWGSQN